MDTPSYCCHNCSAAFMLTSVRIDFNTGLTWWGKDFGPRFCPQCGHPYVLHSALRRNFPKPKPAFECANCGATGNTVLAFSRGHFVASLFEQDKARWDAQHEHCLPIQDGGCI